ncbi:glucosamine-6-phosphate deaminase [Leucobacter insecticola]|uniref:Glucosamine-6-phosphate deaminase n=1 Tax=Leucobacter insecticola TaxID=2714934 RepID=A0A6G8FHV6_9MICO|nr:glucosamine-6-phosphate deaminase [Leucobacter insecticola]QIM15944.1 glucosamine-6-phosphate deaminase [Leucobacter insecticola]
MNNELVSAVEVFGGSEELGVAVAELMVAEIRRDPEAVVGLATGSSPVAAYSAWGEMARAEGLDQSRVRGFALDEYIGIDPSHPESFHAVVAREAIGLAGLVPSQVRVPQAASFSETAAAGAEYEEAIRAAGGIGVQILGIGRNGHLAFNEPGSDPDSRTRGVTLTAETRSDNARFFDSVDEVPEYAITQGLGTIFEARELLVIATGGAKAAAVAAAIQGPETLDVPASLLRRHPRVRWFLDEAAAAELDRDRL